MDIGTLLTIIGMVITVSVGYIILSHKMGHSLHRLERTETDMNEVKEKINVLERMELAVHHIKERVDSIPALVGDVATITKRVDTLWERAFALSHSPRQLSPLGERVLKSSGIAKIVDDRFDQIVTKVREINPPNAFQAEQTVIDAVSDLRNDPALTGALENGAFQSGVDIDSVLLVGGIYIRDRILGALGLSTEDSEKKPD